jgi:hypothetical protein
MELEVATVGPVSNAEQVAYFTIPIFSEDRIDIDSKAFARAALKALDFACDRGYARVFMDRPISYIDRPAGLVESQLHFMAE